MKDVRQVYATLVDLASYLYRAGRTPRHSKQQIRLRPY
jgi:hypothetical protein